LAVALDIDKLEADLPRDRRLVIDTSAAIAYLHGGERASPAAAWVFDGCLATGRNPAVMSALSVAELMVGPSKAGAAAMGTMEGFLRFFSGMRVAPFEEATARAAAAVRASTGLSLPDAAVVATALEHDAATIVTNDARWPAALRASSISVVVCLLADYAGLAAERILPP
jgi:predicted nucleic acid-binding protein